MRSIKEAMVCSGIQVLLVDNYDSFTYNIAHIVRNHPGTNLRIVKAGDLTPEEAGSFDKIIFSPGPDLPEPGNVMETILAQYASKKSIVGICLGFQAICLYFGGRLKQLAEPVHGKALLIGKTGASSKILSEVPEQFEAGLYHSWIADPDFLPGCLTVTSATSAGRIMSVRHREYDIEAVQFHPESVMTPMGARMLHSWLA